ncbi:molybdopterin-dependent oxidoreductase [Bacillus mangrovi]|uniref:Molybdopterin-dependent oxidoreductase n=1 Tax=Metabacillus mangrovi TaxID=1491830 RepID=A0A7X2S7H9_9BACI|nr:molybdopterin-dependent oxidoreductase [Metabacillus mangrovi]MTH54802.1 molybdopterin-dependent oxidoreductase [Metabacillus mangrovi]
MKSYIDQKDGIVKSVCSLDCPDQCGLLIHKENGRISKIEGDPDHPVTRGSICNKVRHMGERLYDPKRLVYPMKRTGKKGEGQFERISWEEAVHLIHSRWKSLIEEEGPESILPYSFYGNMGLLNAEGMDRRFFHQLGASRLDRAICNAAGSAGYNYTMGGSFGTDPEDTIHSKLIILWGINAVSTNMHQMTLALKARKNGAKIVVIDVHNNQTGRMADWFIPILPGTDSALALGMMHILFEKKFTVPEFLESWTTGHEELRKHVRQYDPDTVSAITGVPREDLYQLARMYGEISPSFIRIGNGLQHHDNGGMAVRTIACLPALTGQWLHKGGGALKGNSGFLQHDEAALTRPDLLQNKQTRTINMNEIGRSLLEQDPPIRSLFVYGSNPAIVAPEGNKVRKGLLRDDLFTVVHDLFLTETAAYADLVLPASSSFENMDFYTSYWHHYMQLQVPVVEKYGESKSNVEVFRLLAKAFDMDPEIFGAEEEELIRQAVDDSPNPYIKEITFERLLREHYVRAAVKPLFPGKLPTPSGKIELYSEQMAEAGLPPLPVYTPLVEDDSYPFLFVPGPNHSFMNSTFSSSEKHLRLEKSPKLYLNEADAERLSISNGDSVRVWNDRGECELAAAPGPNVLPGVLVTQGLWADTPSGAKFHVNALTPDRLADMGGGAVFFSGRVNAERVGKAAEK